MNHPHVVPHMTPDRRRVAPIIVPALLGAAMLTDVTQVHAFVRNQSMSAQMGRPSQSPTPSGRWLVLTGTIAYTDPQQGFAIIGNSVQNTYLARPGDQLPDGSRIREIHPKQVVLEYGGNVETVGMYEPAQSAGAVYVQTVPLPQPTRWQEAEVNEAAAGGATPGQPPRPAERQPSEPRPSDTRPWETSAGHVRSHVALPSDTPSGDASPEQAQPQDPSSPASQDDPADEFGDARLQRAESRRK
jgi:hypothetical protein